VRIRTIFVNQFKYKYDSKGDKMKEDCKEKGYITTTVIISKRIFVKKEEGDIFPFPTDPNHT